MERDEKVFVSGAGGFIGGWIAESLSNSDLTVVRAGIRRWASAGRIGRFPLEIVKCDILDINELTRALDGVTAVVHCALGPRNVIVDGTRNTLESAYKTGISHFVHISTSEVYGEISGDIDESYPMQFTGNPYGDAKIEAEQICEEYRKKGLSITILRPSIVYGPFSKLWTIRVADRLASGRWSLRDDVYKGVCNLVYIGDLIQAINLALKNRKIHSNTYNINGEERVEWREYFQAFFDALGLDESCLKRPVDSAVLAHFMLPVRKTAKFLLNRFRTSISDLYSQYEWAKVLMKCFESAIRRTPTPTELNLYERNAYYTISKAKEELGYCPKYYMEEGLRLSTEWLLHHELI